MLKFYIPEWKSINLDKLVLYQEEIIVFYLLHL